MLLQSWSANLAQLCAQNAIDSDRLADTARRGLLQASTGALETRNEERNQAHLMRTGANMVQVAQAGVQLVTSAVQLGQAVDAMPKQQATANELQTRFDAARADPSARAELESADMGGRTIGERFSGSELDALLERGDGAERLTVLRQAGFDDREIDAIDHGRAGEVLAGHAQTPAESRAAEAENRIKAAIETAIWRDVGSCFEQQAPEAEARAASLDERAGALRTIAGLIADATQRHIDKLDALEARKPNER